MNNQHCPATRVERCWDSFGFCFFVFSRILSAFSSCYLGKKRSVLHEVVANDLCSI